MPPVQIDDLAPTPEGPCAELTPEQMRRLRGGASELMRPPPSQADHPESKPSPLPWFDPAQFPWNVLGQLPNPLGEPLRGPGPFPID